jgi:hypothetical protein
MGEEVQWLLGMVDVIRGVRRERGSVTHITTACWTLHLQSLAVILVESLQTVDQSAIDLLHTGVTTHLSISRKFTANQIGPRQFELPPNMPDFESPGQ